MPASRPSCAGRLTSSIAWLSSACWTAILVTQCGCQLAGPFIASTIQPSADRTASRESKPAPRTIALEVLFVRFGADESATEQAMWNAVDEQSLDGEVRQALALNGVRAGLLPATLSREIQSRLEAASIESEAADEPLPPSHKGLSKRSLRLLPGKESRLVSRAGLPEIVVFEHASEGVHGRTFRDATTGLVLSAWPAADGRCRLAVIPAIEHGPQRRTWIGEEGIFRLESGQTRHAFEPLRVEAELSPETLLAIGAVEQTDSTVGSALFHDPTTGDRRLFVIRPLSRTEDPMFQAPGEDGEDMPAKARKKER